jgi:hypothetical protein
MGEGRYLELIDNVLKTRLSSVRDLFSNEKRLLPEHRRDVHRAIGSCKRVYPYPIANASALPSLMLSSRDKLDPSRDKKGDIPNPAILISALHPCPAAASIPALRGAADVKELVRREASAVAASTARGSSSLRAAQADCIERRAAMADSLMDLVAEGSVRESGWRDAGKGRWRLRTGKGVKGKSRFQMTSISTCHPRKTDLYWRHDHSA